MYIKIHIYIKQCIIIHIDYVRILCTIFIYILIFTIQRNKDLSIGVQTIVGGHLNYNIENHTKYNRYEQAKYEDIGSRYSNPYDRAHSYRSYF